MTGTITERTGPVSYRVQVNDQIWRRHTNQLLSSESTITETVPEVPETLPSVEPRPEMSAPEKVPTTDLRPTESHESSPTPATPPKRYPKRNRKPPDRLV